MLAPYQQYYFAFVLVGMTVALMVAGRGRALRPMMVSDLLALLALTPIIPLIRDNLGDVANARVGFVTGIENGQMRRGS